MPGAGLARLMFDIAKLGKNKMGKKHLIEKIIKLIKKIKIED